MGTQLPHPILAHVYCGQMAEWIKMALGTEVNLGQSDIALYGDPAPLPPGKEYSSQFRPMSIVAKGVNG